MYCIVRREALIALDIERANRNVRNIESDPNLSLLLETLNRITQCLGPLFEKHWIEFLTLKPLFFYGAINLGEFCNIHRLRDFLNGCEQNGVTIEFRREFNELLHCIFADLKRIEDSEVEILQRLNVSPNHIIQWQTRAFPLVIGKFIIPDIYWQNTGRMLISRYADFRGFLLIALNFGIHNILYIFLSI